MCSVAERDMLRLLEPQCRSVFKERLGESARVVFDAIYLPERRWR